MLECLIVGDSVAWGIAEVTPQCNSIVRAGISSTNWYKKFYTHPMFFEKTYKVAVISLSTNDLTNSSTVEHLYNIRKATKANMVIWILPNFLLKPKQYQIVKEVAHEFNDQILDISDKVSFDNTFSLSAYSQMSNSIFKK